MLIIKLFVIDPMWSMAKKTDLKSLKIAESPFCSSHHLTKKKTLFLLAQTVCIKNQQTA